MAHVTRYSVTEECKI